MRPFFARFSDILLNLQSHIIEIGEKQLNANRVRAVEHLYDGAMFVQSGWVAVRLNGLEQQLKLLSHIHLFSEFFSKGLRLIMKEQLAWAAELLPVYSLPMTMTLLLTCRTSTYLGLSKPCG